MSYKSFVYDLIMSNSESGSIHSYSKFLDAIPNGSKILDVGIGNGLCIQYCKDKILAKDLHIQGTDIDEEYIDACRDRIADLDLSNNVSVSLSDFLIDEVNDSFDYIVFSESFPVIEPFLFKEMVKKCREYKKAKIVFLHNLINVTTRNSIDFKIVEFIKNNIKNIPFVWIDMGRATTKHHFDLFLKTMKLKVVESKILISEKYADNPFTNLIYLASKVFLLREPLIDSVDMYMYITENTNGKSN